MTLKEQKQQFEKSKIIYESAKLTFHGVDGYDVYNCSLPFKWNDDWYIYGRVEKRDTWSRSRVYLFKNTGKDEWTVVPGAMVYQLEDPYITWLDDLFVFGGVHIQYQAGEIDTFFSYFYRGTGIHDLYHFTTGPDFMKDIRLVRHSDDTIGIFSRPRGEDILENHGSESLIGYTTIDSFDKLTADVIENAKVIPDLFADKEWGGCNHVYLLDSGLLGIIGHKSYWDKDENGIDIQVYVNVSWVFDPKTHKMVDTKIIATRSCFPKGPYKTKWLPDCAFASGIVERDDGKVDLYSGLGDTEEGRVVIDNPFNGFGKILTK